MPDLTNTVRWLEFLPDLLGNLDSPRPFYFKLNGSMSKEQLLALDAALGERSALPDLPELAKGANDERRAQHEVLRKERDEAARVEVTKKYARALEPYVRLGDEPLSFDSKAVVSLLDYFDTVTRHLAGLELLFEPYRALVNCNTLGVRGHFYSGRLSGGFTTTASRDSGARRGQTVAR